MEEIKPVQLDNLEPVDALKYLNQELTGEYQRDGLVMRAGEGYFASGNVIVGLASREDEPIGTHLAYNPAEISEKTIKEALQGKQPIEGV